MKTTTLLLILLLGLACALAWAEENSIPEASDCVNCHGMPPGVDDSNHSNNPGAHLVHKALGCESCHADGVNPDHINGIISVLPEVGYEFGDSIPWPGQGGGSCGGQYGLPMPTGCHTERADMSCLWIPGDSCKAPGAP